jgi:hypothetical protein
VQAARRDPAARQQQDARDGWRPLSGSLRDLPAVTHERMQEIAVYLWHRNPLGRRIINVQAEWMVGEGASFSVPDPRAQALLKEFWELNRWDISLASVVIELGIFGEECVPCFPNPYSGVIKTGLLDPTWIQEVVPNPDDATQPIGIIQKQHTSGGVERRWKTVLRREDEAMLSPWALKERERFADGEILFTAINKLRTATRGVSDLFCLADWVDGYEQVLFGDMIRSNALNKFVWDYKFTGWDQDEIDEFMAGLQSPRPLSSFGHNESVERTLVGPPAGAASSMAESSRTLRNHVLGGAGQPEHWYGGGGDVNRSTADSMDASVGVKTLTAKQTQLKWMIRDRLLAQVDRGIRVGYLRDTPEVRDVTVTLPDLSTLDVSRISAGMQGIVNGLVMGQQGGFVDEETPAKFVAALGKHVGVEVDAEQMLKRARQQRAGRAADDVAQVYDGRLRGRRGQRAV